MFPIVYIYVREMPVKHGWFFFAFFIFLFFFWFVHNTYSGQTEQIVKKRDNLYSMEHWRAKVTRAHVMHIGKD